jgi:hypothetical protein
MEKLAVKYTGTFFPATHRVFFYLPPCWLGLSDTGRRPFTILHAGQVCPLEEDPVSLYRDRKTFLVWGTKKVFLQGPEDFSGMGKGRFI